MLDDIDQNARAIEDIVSLCEHRSSVPESECQFRILPLSLPRSPPTAFAIPEETEKLNLIYTYDNLVSGWLSYLPHDIPGRTRITKEKVIRRLAADIALSRINISRKLPDGETDPNELSRHQDDAESSNPETSYDFHRTGTPRFSSLPASEIGGNDTSSRSDLVTGNSRISNSQPLDRVSVYSNLSSLTTLRSRPSMSRSAEAVLSHWVQGTDPAAYDWQKVVHSVEGEESQGTSRATTPKRKSRKKTSQGIGMSSPAPPSTPTVPTTHVWGSQPTSGGPSRVTLQSSQVTALDEDLPMTQLERGVFGGREAHKRSVTKTRKKKRAAGF